MSEPLAPTVLGLADAAGDDTAAAVAAVVELVARASGIDADLRLDDEVVPSDRGVLAVGISRSVAALHGPFLPGLVREALVEPGRRREGGVHHTPREVAELVVDVAVSAAGESADPTGLVADPSVGGGVFLLAAAERLTGTREEVVDRLVGCDVDPLAVAVTEAALTLWSGGRRPRPGAIRVGDFLGDSFDHLRPRLVVGNPPFLGQLRSVTGRDGSRRAGLRDRWPDLGGYLDEAGAFLLRASEVVAPDGAVALLQPTSFLAARDAAPVRARLARDAPPVALWTPGRRVFDAAVDVCAVVCRPRQPVSDDAAGRPARGPATTDSVDLLAGVPAVARGSAPLPDAGSWGPLLAATTGVPAVGPGPPGPAATVGDRAAVSAGFRDHFYGLRSAVVDDADGRHRLITSGLIDPLCSHWGARTCRFDRREWRVPSVRMDGVDDGVRDWFEDRLRPKLLVASQSRVIEVIVDVDGSMVPCTPVVVVVPHQPDDLWQLAAALTSPLATAEIATTMTGSALSADALRVSADRIRQVTLPPAGVDLDRAVELTRTAVLGDDTDVGEIVVRIGRSVTAAHRLAAPRAAELHRWWTDRLPHSAPRRNATQ